MKLNMQIVDEPVTPMEFSNDTSGSAGGNLAQKGLNNVQESLQELQKSDSDIPEKQNTSTSRLVDQINYNSYQILNSMQSSCTESSNHQNQTHPPKDAGLKTIPLNIRKPEKFRSAFAQDKGDDFKKNQAKSAKVSKTSVEAYLLTDDDLKDFQQFDLASSLNTKNENESINNKTIGNLLIMMLFY